MPIIPSGFAPGLRRSRRDLCFRGNESFAQTSWVGEIPYVQVSASYLRTGHFLKNGIDSSPISQGVGVFNHAYERVNPTPQHHELTLPQATLTGDAAN